MIDEQRRYTSIPLPFGLFQVLEDFDIYNPDSPKFDPIRSIEYVASPIHFIVNRRSTNSAESLFVSDLRNATFSRDLSRYTGFVPASSVLGEGLASPNWGGTIKFHRTSGGGYQGIYIGAGPYLSPAGPGHVRSAVNQRPLHRHQRAQRDDADRQRATRGRRRSTESRLSRPLRVGRRESGSQRDGIYVAGNFHYLHGFSMNGMR